MSTGPDPVIPLAGRFNRSRRLLLESNRMNGTGDFTMGVFREPSRAPVAHFPLRGCNPIRAAYNIVQRVRGVPGWMNKFARP